MDRLTDGKGELNIIRWDRFNRLVAVHKGRPQSRGNLVKCGHMRTGGRGKGPYGRPQAGTFLYCFTILGRHSLCGWCLL